MKNREDPNLAATNLVENSKRKSSYDNATDVVMNFRIHFWVSSNTLNRFIDAKSELGTQPFSLMFVPGNRIAELTLCVRMKSDVH
jgi:serine/threonine protein phosphatase PrpC